MSFTWIQEHPWQPGAQIQNSIAIDTDKQGLALGFIPHHQLLFTVYNVRKNGKSGTTPCSFGFSAPRG
jgi:hypothetical protein